jgi:hypothetical protein
MKTDEHNHRPAVDAGTGVQFAIRHDCPGTTEADRYCEEVMKPREQPVAPVIQACKP